MPAPHVNDRQIERAETPVGDDLDELAFPHETGLDDRRKVADAAASAGARPAKSFIEKWGWKVRVSLSFPFL